MIKTPKAKEYGKKLQELSLKYVAKNAKLFKANEESYNRDMGMIFSDGADLYSMGGYMAHGDLIPLLILPLGSILLSVKQFRTISGPTSINTPINI